MGELIIKDDALEVVNPNYQHSLVRCIGIVNAVKDFCKEAMGVTVQDADTEAQAVMLKSVIKSAIKKYAQESKYWPSILWKAHKAVTAIFNATGKPLDDADGHLDKVLREYHEKQLKTQQKEIKKARANAKDSPIPEAVIPYIEGPTKTVQTEVGKMTYIETWRAEVVKIQDVPTFYDDAQILKPDMVAIQKLVNEGIREIPGLRIFKIVQTRTS